VAGLTDQSAQLLDMGQSHYQGGIDEVSKAYRALV